MDHKSFHGYHWKEGNQFLEGSERFSDIGTEKIEPSVIVWPCPHSSRLSYPTKPLGLGTLLLWVWVHPCAMKVIMLHWEGRNLLPLRGGPLASFGGSFHALPAQQMDTPRSGYKLSPRPWELSALPLLGPVFARRKHPQHPHKENRKEPSHYLHCVGTCSCLPPASRCLFQDHKPRHSSSPRARHAHLWRTAAHWGPQPLKGRAQSPSLRLAAVTRNQEAWHLSWTAVTGRVTWGVQFCLSRTQGPHL